MFNKTIRNLLTRKKLDNQKKKMNIKKAVIVIGFLFFIITTVLSWDGIKELFSIENSDSNYNTNLNIFPVKVIKVNKQKIIPTISVLGTIEEFEKVKITSKISGSIENIYVQEGDRVKKNSKLAQIERLPLELELKKNIAQLNEAKSSLAYAKQKLYDKRKEAEIKINRIVKLRANFKKLKAKLKKMKATFKGKKELYKEEGISKEEYQTVRTELISTESQYIAALKDLQIAKVGYRNSDIKAMGYKVPKDKKKKFQLFVEINSGLEKAEVQKAEARLNSAKIAVQSTRRLLRETTIRSPINGIVALRNKGIGENVGSGNVSSNSEPIMILVDIHKLYATFNVRASELIYIKKGIKIEFTVDVYRNEKFIGIVRCINPVIDGKTHTAKVKALLNNHNEKLKPGMFIRSKIITGGLKHIVLLPTEAIIPKEGNNGWAFVYNKDRIYKIEIKTGNEFENKTEILSGIKDGDLVAIEKLSQLREGVRIKPIVTSL